MSIVWRYVLGVQPVGDGLIKDTCSLCFLYNLYSATYIYL
jgi:hypothetical protein